MNDEAQAAGEIPARRDLSPKQELLARLIAGGESHANAYRRAYGKHNLRPQMAANGVYKVLAANPAILARVDELKAKAEATVILSLNDRLGLLSRAARLPVTTASERSALARVVKTYNETAGDHAPDRQEVTVKGDENAPLHVVHRTATKAEKIAQMRRMRDARSAAAQPQPVSA